MRLTVRQLKALIREAAEEAIEETYSRGGEGGNRWGDSWDTGKEEDSYEEAMRKDREARSKPDFYKHDESEVNPILRDRMYRIQTKGYNQKQKTVISNNYLLPKIREQVKFTKEDIIIPDEAIHYIIDNLCNKEDGVRNLKRCLEIIYTKLNLYRLMKPGSNLFEEDMSLKVEFPFVVTKDIVDKLIKDKKELNSALSYLYV